MTIFMPDRSLMGTGFIGHLNDVAWLLWTIMSVLGIYYVAVCMPVLALVDRMHLRRRRRLFGDERVWVKDLLAAEGRPPLRRSQLPGRHRCAKRRTMPRQLLYELVGWPFRPPTSAQRAAFARRMTQRQVVRRHARA